MLGAGCTKPYRCGCLCFYSSGARVIEAHDMPIRATDNAVVRQGRRVDFKRFVKVGGDRVCCASAWHHSGAVLCVSGRYPW